MKVNPYNTLDGMLDGLKTFLENYIDEPGETTVNDFSFWLEVVKSYIEPKKIKRLELFDCKETDQDSDMSFFNEDNCRAISVYYLPDRIDVRIKDHVYEGDVHFAYAGNYRITYLTK